MPLPATPIRLRVGNFRGSDYEVGADLSLEAPLIGFRNDPRAMLGCSTDRTDPVLQLVEDFVPEVRWRKSP